MNTEEFYKLPKALALADGYISKKTGEPVKLSASAKIIYAYMLCKNEFFTEKLSGQHFETQGTIAKACGLEYKAAGNILRAFMDHEVMTGKKLRPNGEGQWRWHYYKVFTDLVLWEGSTDKFELIPEVQVKSKEPEKKPLPKPPVYQPEPSWMDDTDLPF